MADAGVEARAFAGLDRVGAGMPAIGLALSGGGDSTALLHLASDWARTRNVSLAAATVDHGLRPEAAAEARAAGQAAAGLGVPHTVLHWNGPAPTGNLAAQARAARLQLIGGWARSSGLQAVALGHTRDDVAETLLMRLGRGAGLTGLAAMADRREAEGMIWLRPLLGVGREELRGYLTTLGVGWTDDPSNDDLRHDRARIRAAMAALNLDAARLAESAGHLADAREALLPLADQAVVGATMVRGDLTLMRPGFATAAREVQRQILVAAVATVTGQGYPPRRDTLAYALATLAAGRRVTLDGTIITPKAASIMVAREPAAAARADDLHIDGVWDRRWRIAGLSAGLVVRALPGAAAPALWQAAACLGPLPQAEVAASPLRDLADFRRKLGIPPTTDPAPH